MADSGIFGKTLMGQRPRTEENDDLEELNYYMRLGDDDFATGNPADQEEVSAGEAAIQTERFSQEEDMDVLEPVEVFHAENIDPDGNVKAFNLYDGELPLDLEVGTSVAAKVLGCTEQTIRNYCKDFQEFLDIRVVNKRRKLTVESLRKLDKIMHIKEERRYDREQMKAFLRNEGRETLAVTEEERIQILSEMVSQRVAGELMEKFSEDDGFLAQMSEVLAGVVSEKVDLSLQKLQIDQMNQQIQSSIDRLSEKENEIKELIDQFAAEKEKDGQNDRKRLQDLEERLDAAQKETSEALASSKQKDEMIEKLQADLDQLKESAKKKRFRFFR